jgi:hypothetical protein
MGDKSGLMDVSVLHAQPAISDGRAPIAVQSRPRSMMDTGISQRLQPTIGKDLGQLAGGA